MSEPALEIFRDACGLRAPLALECRGADRTIEGFDTHRLDYPFATVGRDPRSDLVLQGAEVSRLHAIFQVVEGRVFCIDLNSRTQLRWEGEAERRAHGWLEPGGTVWIGSHGIRATGIERSGDLATQCLDPLGSSASDATDAHEPPRAGLELPIRMGAGEQLWQMDGRLALVGRSESCQIMLRDASVSRFHASLLRTSKGVWIVDLQSREGVVINGVRVKWAWLEDGDTVRIGQFSFILRYEAPPAPICREVVPLEAGASPAVPGVTGRSGKGGTTLAVRAPSRPATPARVTKPSPALTPDLVVPASASQWEQGIAVPPQQLAMWQQQMQMMESFHQDMILMVQMFVAMHREHRVAIRDELDRVQKLTKKLSVLQKKLTQTAGSDEENRSQGAERPEPVVGKPDRSGRNGTTRDQGVWPPGDEKPGQSRSAQPPAAQPNSGAGTPVTTSTDHARKAAGSPATPASHAELHSHLTQRIAELQRERQSYWQRILSAISK